MSNQINLFTTGASLLSEWRTSLFDVLFAAAVQQQQQHTYSAGAGGYVYSIGLIWPIEQSSRTATLRRNSSGDFTHVNANVWVAGQWSWGVILCSGGIFYSVKFEMFFRFRAEHRIQQLVHSQSFQFQNFYKFLIVNSCT